MSQAYTRSAATQMMVLWRLDLADGASYEIGANSTNAHSAEIAKPPESDSDLRDTVPFLAG